MIGTELRSRGTMNTWSRLPQDVSGRWHGYPLLARVSFLKERGKGKRGRESERGEGKSRSQQGREKRVRRIKLFLPIW